MSPEQARGQNSGRALGYLEPGRGLYEMVGGMRAFPGETPSDCIASILTAEPPPLSGVLPDVPLKLNPFCKRLCAKTRMSVTRRAGKCSPTSASQGRTENGSPPRPKRVPDLSPAQSNVTSGACYSLWRRRSWRPRRSPTLFFFVAPRPPPNEKSIAVLPFENLSEDKSNAYFADGIQDEILTRLSKIADLKVISRTSTQRYKDTSQSLSEIAEQLGVANLLEGSVQKTNDQVRVNVQLIRAANDSHLWAETFDRRLTDIFSVESEVAKAIADQLRAKLTRQEEQIIAARPTDNLRLTMPTCVAWLYTENGKFTRQHPWRTEISQRSGAVGPQVRP